MCIGIKNKYNITKNNYYWNFLYTEVIRITERNDQAVKTRRKLIK